MANQQEIPKLNGWTMTGPAAGQIVVAKLDGWTMLQPAPRRQAKTRRLAYPHK